MDIVLLGPPGVGKGTQAERLEKLLKVPHIATGDIFRRLSNEDSALAGEVRTFMERGEYVPDDLTIKVFCAEFGRPEVRDGFVLDGFPRTTRQATVLDEALAAQGRKVDRALYITAPAAVLAARISGRIQCPECSAVYNTVTNPPRLSMVCDECGHALIRRADEEPDVVRARIDTYIRETEPVIAFYREAGILSEVDGSLPISEVEGKIDTALGSQSTPARNRNA